MSNTTFFAPLADERLDQVNEDLMLLQKKDGLTFGTDAFLLAAYLRPEARQTAVELGCGTGIISLLAGARNKYKKIIAVELQQSFAEMAKRNVIGNQLADRIEVLCADVRDLCAETVGGEVAAVFANPPYMRTDSGKGNLSCAKQIARHEVCGGIADFAACASRLLKYGGKFYCVYRPDRLIDLLDAMRKNALEPKKMTLVHAHASSAPSMALIEAKKGASPSLILTRPLFLTKQDKTTQTEDAKRIYETCSFEDFWKV